MPVEPWLTTVDQIGGSDRSIHIWAMPIQAREQDISRFELALSSDEKERSDRFHFSHLRHSFILTRGALRFLLGRYLNIAPSELQLGYSATGKPFVTSQANLKFNISHSGDIALYAFSTASELGIDVERIRRLPDMLDIASEFFCQEEFREISSLPVEQRDLSFFLCWTRKEAYIKAIGTGLSVPLNEFRVTVRPEEPARLLHIHNDEQRAKDWTLHDLTDEMNYAAALAYQGEPRPILMRSLSDPSQLLDI
jgi:4'-phosphopantetheinyl transferase